MSTRRLEYCDVAPGVLCRLVNRENGITTPCFVIRLATKSRTPNRIVISHPSPHTRAYAGGHARPGWTKPRAVSITDLTTPEPADTARISDFERDNGPCPFLK